MVTAPRLPPDADEETLVAQLRTGDRASFNIIAERYAETLMRFAYSFVRGVDDAEDIVQDVLLWVWMHREELDPKRPLKAYLLRAVGNRARNVVAQRSTRARIAETHLRPDRAAGAIRNEIENVEEVDRALWQSIDVLPETYRTALVLRYVQHVSHADMGIVLGVTEMAAKKLVYRALAALKKAMGGQASSA